MGGPVPVPVRSGAVRCGLKRSGDLINQGSRTKGRGPRAKGQVPRVPGLARVGARVGEGLGMVWAGMMVAKAKGCGGKGIPLQTTQTASLHSLPPLLLQARRLQYYSAGVPALAAPAVFLQPLADAHPCSWCVPALRSPLPRALERRDPSRPSWPPCRMSRLPPRPGRRDALACSPPAMARSPCQARTLQSPLRSR